MESGYTGSIEADMGGASMPDITVSGQDMTFYIPDADIPVVVTFADDGFSGSIGGALGEAVIVGKKRG